MIRQNPLFSPCLRKVTSQVRELQDYQPDQLLEQNTYGNHTESDEALS